MSSDPVETTDAPVPVTDPGGQSAPADPVDPPAAPSLRSRAIRGSVWTIAGYGANQVLRLGGNLVLTRLLFPEAFGLMALITVFMRGLTMFSDMGIGPSIIQNKRGDDPAFLNTAWTIQVVRGFLLWLGSCAIALPVAGFYGEPMLARLLPVAGLTALIAGFNSTALFTCNRHLRLGRLTLLELGAYMPGLVVTIVWAWLSRSVWALVGGMLVIAVIKMVLTHVALPGPRNRFAWDRQAGAAIWRFGRWIFVSTTIAFFAMQSDRLLLGKLVPLDLLGIYSIALMLARLPCEIGLRLSAGVLYPALAAHARDGRAALAKTLLDTRRTVLPPAVAATLALVVLAPSFFRLLYDDRYGAAAWMAPLLGISVWFTLLQASADRALLTVEDARSLALSNVGKLIVTGAGSLIGHHLAGIAGFIAGVGLGAAAGHVAVQLAMARRAMPIHRQDLAYTLLLVALVAVGIGGTAALRGVFDSARAPGFAVGWMALLLVAVGCWVAKRMWTGALRR